MPSPKPLHLITLPLLLSVSLSVQATPADEPCAETAQVRLWTSPAHPARGQMFKIMAVATDEPVDSLSLTGPESAPRTIPSTPRGGPPWSLGAEMTWTGDAPLRIEARRGGEMIACRIIKPGSGQATSPPDWNLPTEAFYSAWIEQLFDAPVDENLSFKSLAPVLRDPERNFLHNHLGNDEDLRLPATPDCADLPYFLRSYFAWKIGLPVSYRACDRGTSSRPPHCGAPIVDDRLAGGEAPASTFNSLMRKIADTVHSGSARTDLSDEATDFYPVPLRRDSLWPGTVYADPYGHTLILVKWVPQTAGQSGLLLAADAQPDNSVARKRFWEGNFLFAQLRSAGPGFKAFRPLLAANDHLTLPRNTQLAVNSPTAPYSDEQAALDPDEFYARIEKILNPRGLTPERAYDAMLDALVEQLNTRVGAIENGNDWRQHHTQATIPMPAGPAIFETMGPWEDYATPSRDMRLLIAMNVLEQLPDRIVTHPDLFQLDGSGPDAARDTLSARHERESRERHFSYRRSDGSSWELSVADVLARRAALEMGYNPNDCPEMRWGAPVNSEEASTCNRRAPADQQNRMNDYKVWFHNTQRPAR